MIEVRNLKKTYKPKKGEPVNALDDITIQFEETGLVFILGKSGSGKSTLLNMLGGLDRFDSGEIIIKGKSSKNFSQSDFDSYRNTFIGFIFQEYNILNDFTVGANIALAMELQGKKPKKEELNRILEEVDLSGFAGRKPNELSGGQKQRVAIARALIKNPQIIMADEPTGALDSKTGKQVFDTLKKLSKNKLVIVVSHDRDFAEQYGDRVIELSDGKIISDIKKYVAKPNELSSGMSIIDDKIIHIKPGYTLTNEDLYMIQTYLQKNNKTDQFISIDKKTNDEIKRVARIDVNGNKESFEDTTTDNINIKKYDATKFKLIKSKLPLKNSLKMAFSSLKKKPIRLFITILLSTVAFTLFGLVNTMSSYDKVEANVDSIIDTKINYISYAKEVKHQNDNYSYYFDDLLTKEDVNNIKSKFPNYTFTPIQTPAGDGELDFSYLVYDKEKLTPNGENNYYPKGFSGIVTFDENQLKTYGYEITGTFPKNDNEIAITKYCAETFLDANMINESDHSMIKINSVNDLISKKIKLNIVGEDIEYTISGIVDTKLDTSRYEKFKEEIKGGTSLNEYMLLLEFRNIVNYSLNQVVFVNENTLNAAEKNTFIKPICAYNYYIDMKSGSNYLNVTNVTTLDMMNDETKSKLVFFEQNKETLDDNEVILPLSTIEELGKISINETTLDEKKQEILNQKELIADVFINVSAQNYLNDDDMSTQLKLAGVYIDTMDESINTAILSTNYLKKVGVSFDSIYRAVCTNMTSDREELSKFVRYSYDNEIDNIHYPLMNNVSESITYVNSIVSLMEKVFLYVGIAFAIFAGIMLMNFIATSISYKKREIGILRAVGARGNDVFGIFFQESLIIAIINFLLATIITAIIVSIINAAIRDKLNLLVTLMHFGLTQILSILAISVFVAFISSFLPVYKISKKKPIEAIRKA